jgi:(p)ppGpp synthase/HD superfamily hydrolase
MEEIEKTKQKILQKSPKAFSKDISKAMKYIENKEPALVRHLFKTALTVAELGFDATTIIAAILHDAEPDDSFDNDILELVKGVRRIEATTKNEDTKDEIITKYILNNAKDLRSVIIKLASVLDKIKHIEGFKPEKQKRYLRQALSIYSDIAEYLDFGDMKKEIDETVFEITQPTEYEAINKKYVEANIDNQLLKKYIALLKRNTEGLDIEITGRIKSKYSVYNKLKKYEKEWKSPDIKSIYDLVAFRCITKTADDCFEVLEKIMDSGELNTERFVDYLSSPKVNGYQAIHSVVSFRDISQLEVEIQILTHDMHNINTYGKASHIAYKASKSRYANPTDKYGWVKEVHSAIQRNIQNREKDINTPININLFQEDIFAFTPKGEIIPLSKGDTALDFAYRIHSQIGNSAVGVKINGKAAGLGQTLETGDMVEIKTQKDKAHQNMGALQHVNSQSSKARILKTILKHQKN